MSGYITAVFNKQACTTELSTNLSLIIEWFADHAYGNPTREHNVANQRDPELCTLAIEFSLRPAFPN